MGDLKIAFDQGIANFVDGKAIDFHDGPQPGFSITDPLVDNKGGKCDGGCC